MRFIDKIRAAVKAAIGKGRPKPGVAFNPPKGGQQNRPPRGPATKPRPRPQRDEDLPFGEEIADEPKPDPDAGLPFAEELTETEAYIYGGGTIHCDSTWIEEFKYVGSEKQLYILVKGTAKRKRQQYGRVYRLDNVSFEKVMAFYHYGSFGRYFNRFLKGKHSGAKLGTMPTSKGPNVLATID